MSTLAERLPSTSAAIATGEARARDLLPRDASTARAREWQVLRAALIVLDLCALFAASQLALHIRFTSGAWWHLRSAYAIDPDSAQLYLRLSLVVIPVWLAIFALRRLYHFEQLLAGYDEYARVVKACTYGLVLIMIFSFLERDTLVVGESVVSRGWALMFWALGAAFLLGERFLVRRAIWALRRRGLFISRAVLVGANEQGLAIARQLHPAYHSGVAVIGFLDDYLPLGTLVDCQNAPSISPNGNGSGLSSGPANGRVRRHEEARRIPVLGTPGDLAEVAQRQAVDEAIVVPHAISWESYTTLLEACSANSLRAEVRLSPGLYDLLTTGVRVVTRGSVPLLAPNSTRISELDALLKRTFDIAMSAALLVLLLPLLVPLGILTRSAFGRVFDREAVRGERGRRFCMRSFATSPPPTDGAHHPSLPTHHLATWLQNFYRRTRLNRLPRLLHVLTGCMSLVGPQPHPEEVFHHAPRAMANLRAMRPGLVGAWAVDGGASLNLEERIRSDVYYVRNYSPWLDLFVLWQSAKILVRRLFAPGAWAIRRS